MRARRRRRRAVEGLATRAAEAAAAAASLLGLLLLGIALAPSDLQAQEDATPETTLRMGDLVRIRPLGVTRHDFRSYRKGTVTELAGGWLTISRERSGEPYRIATDSIRTLAVADGTVGHGVTGAALGFLLGCGIGGAIAELTADSLDDPLAGLGGCLCGSFTGALVGGFAGSYIKSTRWAEVPLEDLRLGIGPSRRKLRTWVPVLPVTSTCFSFVPANWFS